MSAAYLKSPTTYSSGTFLIQEPLSNQVKKTFFLKKWIKNFSNTTGQAKKYHLDDISTITFIPFVEKPKIMPIEIAVLAKKQEIVEKRNMPLMCRSLTDLPEICSSSILDEERKAYLEANKEFSAQSEITRIHCKLVKALEIISFKTLHFGLLACCQELEKQLNNEEYVARIAFEKSQQWITEIALGFLKNLPYAVFESYRKLYDIRIKNIVLFDDVSYSGMQIAETAKAVRRACQNCKIFVVIPFMSPKAIDELSEISNISIITTTKTICTINQLLSEQELKTYKAYKQTQRRLPGYTCTTTKWTTPDKVSLCEKAAEFVTPITPVYKPRCKL